MPSRLIAVVSMIAFLSAQTPSGFAQTAVQSPSAQNTSMQSLLAETATHGEPSSAQQTITVPAGTAIPLTLINPIRSKSSKPGDAVRATVAFPVTVGTEVAIPAGSYVEGALQQVTARAGSTGQPEVTIHFTRLLFANGYSVGLDAENTQAEWQAPATPGAITPAEETTSDPMPLRDVSAPAADPQPHLLRAAYALEGQQQPALPPLPQVGPSPGVVIGAVMGGAAAFTIGMLLWSRHRAGSLDYVLFDGGWQFQIVLQKQLVIDPARAAAAGN